MNSMLSRIGEPSISLICDPAAVKYDSQLLVVEIYTFLEKYWKGALEAFIFSLFLYSI